MNKSIKPDYSKIYRDIVAKKFPTKRALFPYPEKEKPFGIGYY
jgi:hypothetical protein